MTHVPRVRVYMACSVDGFIAGPDHNVDWLDVDRTAPDDLAADPSVLGFEQFMSDVGAMLMGRHTYDFVERAGVWHYGETPVVVATTRPLVPVAPTVESASGTIDALVERARSLAGDRDVYLDGGDLVRQALDAGLVDEMTLTVVPVLLGEGIRLFEGLTRSVEVQFTAHRAHPGGMLQITLRRRDGA